MLGKKNRKFWFMTASLLSLLVLLSGCVDTYKSGARAGQPTGNGWIYNLLVKPMSEAINFFVHNFNWNYGWAIIVITIIVRLIIIMPLGFYQSRKSLMQSERMAALKPQIDEAQKRIKEATTREEQMEAQTQLQAIYKENGLSMTGAIGCLPLLVQMPFFTALYYAARFTPGINESTFYGIQLGKPSIPLLIIVGLIYLLQGFISLIGLPEEQKKMMRTTAFMSPIMIVFISISAPAGVDLYWIIGGIFSCIQSLITNLYHKPKIKAAIAEELKKNPPKVVVSPTLKKAEKAPVKSQQALNKAQKQQKKNALGGRNAGKQQRPRE